MLIFWLALSRKWGNEARHGYNGDSFPHSPLRASGGWKHPFGACHSDHWITWIINEVLRVHENISISISLPKHTIPHEGQSRLLDSKLLPRCWFQSLVFLVSPQKFVGKSTSHFDAVFCFQYMGSRFKVQPSPPNLGAPKRTPGERHRRQHLPLWSHRWWGWMADVVGRRGRIGVVKW